MSTIENNKLIADLQERLRLKEEALERVLNSKTLDEAKDVVNSLNEAEASVGMVQRFLTPRIPMWIGVEIPTMDGFMRVCIGLHQEDGNEVSFMNNHDLELSKKVGYSPWCYGNSNLGETKLSVAYTENSIVFDDNHELIDRL
jgi:hypothetical protein